VILSKCILPDDRSTTAIDFLDELEIDYSAPYIARGRIRESRSRDAVL
jgi:hypothetical protein